MPNKHKGISVDADDKFLAAVGTGAERKLRVQGERSAEIWFGLGVFGLVGWSIAVPTALGGLLGWWWDRHHPSVHPRTLALLVGGLVLGCTNAWLWIVHQNNAMHGRKDGAIE